MFHHLVCDALFFLRLKTILLFVSFENEQGCCTRIHNGELVIRATVMDQIYKYALSQHPNSERLRLQNHWASSSSDIISLFDKGHNWIGVDAVALMLTELGIEFEFADWQTLKLSLTQIHQTGSDDDGFADTSDFGSHARSPRQLESQPSQSQSQAQSQDAQAGVDSSDGINIDIDDDQERETGEQAQEERIKILEEKVAYLQKLSRRNALITHLQSSKRIIQQRVRRLHKDMENMKDQHKQELIKIKHGENSAFHIERKSDKPKSWLTPQGTVAVALRRNIGNVSCALLGHVVLQDLAGCTVSRCEVKTAAALVAHSQMFYEQLQHSFQILLIFLINVWQFTHSGRTLQILGSGGKASFQQLKSKVFSQQTCHQWMLPSRMDTPSDAWEMFNGWQTAVVWVQQRFAGNKCNQLDVLHGMKCFSSPRQFFFHRGWGEGIKMHQQQRLFQQRQ